MNYCNGTLSKVLNDGSTTLDAAKRAELLNMAEAEYVVRDVPSIPFARPLFLISRAGRPFGVTE